jgi:beta-galactosidase
VIICVGPYITTEVDFGKYPYWMVKKEGIVIRRPNKVCYQLIDRYFDQLIPRLIPLQYYLGDNIINFHIEVDSDISIISVNETHQHYEYLRDGLRRRGIQSLINKLALPDDSSLKTAIIPNTWTALEYSVHQ